MQEKRSNQERDALDSPRGDPKLTSQVDVVGLKHSHPGERQGMEQIHDTDEEIGGA